MGKCSVLQPTQSQKKNNMAKVMNNFFYQLERIAYRRIVIIKLTKKDRIINSSTRSTSQGIAYIKEEGKKLKSSSGGPSLIALCDHRASNKLHERENI